MLCPACLLFSIERDTAVTVEGTQYCGQHGVEALTRAQMPIRRGSAAMPGALPFSAPTEPPADT